MLNVKNEVLPNNGSAKIQSGSALKPDQQAHMSRVGKMLLASFLALYILVFAIRLPKLIFEGQPVLLAQAILYALLAVGGILLFRRELIAGILDWKLSAPKNILWIIGALVVGTIVTSIAAYPAYMAGYEDLMDNSTGVLLMVETIGKPFAILVIGFAAPVVEELVFRGFLIGRLKSKIPLWMCVILSSALFALIHLQGLSVESFLCVLPGFGTGLIYGTVYAATKNITLPIIMHIANNTIGMMLLG